MSISKNYLLNILLTMTGILFPIVTFPYISRVLMPEYVGKITFAQSIVFYFSTLALLGIPIYGLRELSKFREEIDKFKQTLTELLIIGILGSCISFVLFIIVVNSNETLNRIKDILQVFSLQVILSFLSLDYVFIVLEKHKRRAYRALSLRITSILLMYIFVKSYEDYLIYTMILVIPEMIIRILDFLTIKKYLSFNSKIEIKKHIRPLFILFLSALSVSLYVSLDSTMLGFMKGNIEVGLYASASKMTKIVIPIIISLETVIAPSLIYAIKKKDLEKIYSKIDIFLDYNFFLGIQILFLLLILSRDITLLFSGERFIESIETMKIMLPIVIFIPIGSFMGNKILISNNLEETTLKLNILGMIFNLVLNIIFIPKYGILGAGFSTMVTEGMMCILKTYMVKKIYPNYKVITNNRLKYVTTGISITSLILFFEKKIIIFSHILNIFIVSIIYFSIFLVVLFLSKDRILMNSLKKIGLNKKNYKY